MTPYFLVSYQFKLYLNGAHGQLVIYGNGLMFQFKGEFTPQLELSSLAVNNPRKMKQKTSSKMTGTYWQGNLNKKFHQLRVTSLTSKKRGFISVLAKLAIQLALLLHKLYAEKVCLPVKHFLS